jgi:hypothetical protein
MDLGFCGFALYYRTWQPVGATKDAVHAIAELLLALRVYGKGVQTLPRVITLEEMK